MAWDFSTEPEFEKKLDWIRDFVRDEVEPLEVLFPGCEFLPLDDERRRIVDPLKQQVRDQGLWAPHLGPELGGQGFGAVKLTLINEILGRSTWAPIVFGTQAPDTGNAEILARFGTQEQKDRYLAGLLSGEIFSCFSMTEPQGGSDPRVFTTRAVREAEGEHWVINGRKYFSSNASVASFFIVVAITDPDVPVHRGASTFLIPAGTPGLNIEATHHLVGSPPHEPGHSLVHYDNVRVPAIVDARRARAGLPDPAVPAGRRAHPPRDALHRGGAARHRHDGPPGEKPLHPRQFAGRQATGAGVHRRLLRRADAVPADRAARRLAHRHRRRARRPQGDRRLQDPGVPGAQVHRTARHPGARRDRAHRTAAVGQRAARRDRARPGRRTDRSAQGQPGPDAPQGLRGRGSRVAQRVRRQPDRRGEGEVRRPRRPHSGAARGHEHPRRTRPSSVPSTSGTARPARRSTGSWPRPCG